MLRVFGLSSDQAFAGGSGYRPGHSPDCQKTTLKWTASVVVGIKITNGWVTPLQSLPFLSVFAPTPNDLFACTVVVLHNTSNNLKDCADDLSPHQSHAP